MNYLAWLICCYSHYLKKKLKLSAIWLLSFPFLRSLYGVFHSDQTHFYFLLVGSVAIFWCVDDSLLTGVQWHLVALICSSWMISVPNIFCIPGGSFYVAFENCLFSSLPVFNRLWCVVFANKLDRLYRFVWFGNLVPHSSGCLFIPQTFPFLFGSFLVWWSPSCWLSGIIAKNHLEGLRQEEFPLCLIWKTPQFQDLYLIP